MIIRKLTAMPYAQAHVEIDDNGNIHLFSYVTRVVTIDENGWLTCSGTYSQTTRKHISAFMREYTPCDYYTAKWCYENNHKINIHTGEVLPLEEEQ